MRDRLTGIITEELDKRDILKFIKSDREYEKAIRKIVKDVIVDMYRVLWQHNSIFNTLGSK